MTRKNWLTYVFKVSYPSTSKTIKIEAMDEDDAFSKATRNKETKDCINLTLIEVR